MSRDTAAESVPRRVGRYEIVGPLAAGGMAEILLGRLVGPSGFQRAVVIKRILRHLARKKDFVDMFLDEARIVASIRHPNVVQVHELGHEDEELFLVMEYLEGESAAGLMRRLHAAGENLDFALCAYIVAEACSGLHAAHELTDASGKHLGVVHRDVTPHNVFIGYGGAIKLLDFGIATASEESGRVAQTEAGQFKGKLEYASPEQCKGKPLDRRSDIFALGTILWELTTGMRLFKRPSAFDMARAICERPIPSPTSIVKDYPDELAAITMRALARSRKERYQSALELRRDLLAAMRKLSPSPTPDEDLAQVMRRLFADRIEEKTEMLRHVQGGSDVTSVPAGEADESVQIPVAQTSDPEEHTETDSQIEPEAPKVTSSTEIMPLAPETTATGTTGGVATPGEFRPQPVRPSRLLSVVVGMGVAAAIIGVILIAFSVGARAVGRRETASAPASAASVEPAAAPSDGPTSTSASAPAPAESAPIAPVRAAVETTVVHVDTVPAKATVFVNGAKKGVSPLDVKLPKGTTPVTIEIRQAGYAPLKERVVPDANQRLRLTLVPEARPAGSTNVPYHRFD